VCLLPLLLPKCDWSWRLVTKEPPISHESDSPSVFSFYTYNKKGQQQLVVGRFFCVYIYVATVAMVTKDCVRTLLLYVRNKMFEEEIEISFFFRVQVLMRNWLDVGIDSFDHKRSINFYSFRVKKPSAYNIDKIMMEELCIL
jgi:hypothetical protein